MHFDLDTHIAAICNEKRESKPCFYTLDLESQQQRHHLNQSSDDDFEYQGSQKDPNFCGSHKLSRHKDRLSVIWLSLFKDYHKNAKYFT